MTYGTLNRSIGGNRYFYGLKEPLVEDKNLTLSPDPFLTVEDLLIIFEAHDYRVSAQELIMAAGLPLSVIKREMKHFEKEGIVQSMRGYAPSGFVISRFSSCRSLTVATPNASATAPANSTWNYGKS